jgi:hypothetical protein
MIWPPLQVVIDCEPSRWAAALNVCCNLSIPRDRRELMFLHVAAMESGAYYALLQGLR